MKSFGSAARLFTMDNLSKEMQGLLHFTANGIIDNKNEKLYDDGRYDENITDHN